MCPASVFTSRAGINTSGPDYNSNREGVWIGTASQLEMIREMIRQFLKCPGEFLTFNQLVFRMPGADKDVLHVVAEQRTDLFLLTRDDRSIRLYTDALQRILQKGIDTAIADPGRPRGAPAQGNDRDRCGHYTEEEILADLIRCSLPPEALTRNCCWRQVCRVRALNHTRIDAETWREVCHVRGYRKRGRIPEDSKHCLL